MTLLEILILILIVLWFGGVAFVPAAGSAVHVLLVVVLVLVAIRLLQGRRL